MSRQARAQGPVVVADDDAETRARVCDALADAGYRSHGVGSGEQALEAALMEPPGLVILEVSLPGMCGYQVCRKLKEQFGDGLPIMFVSGARTEAFDRVGGLLIGADDYLVKPFDLDELVIRVKRLILRSMPFAQAVTSKLTPRELEVLRLLAEGIAPGEIAARLSLSPKTVSTHFDHILSKLGVHTRAQAVAFAYRRDLLGTPV